MEKRVIFILVFVLLVFGISLVFSSDLNAGNKIVGFAVAEADEYLKVKRYNKIEIDLNNQTYYLEVLNVNRNKGKVDLSIKSDPSLGVNDYIEYYFSLILKPFSYADIDGEQVYYRTRKSKTLYLGDDKLYIELDKIKNRRAYLIIKEVD